MKNLWSMYTEAAAIAHTRGDKMGAKGLLKEAMMAHPDSPGEEAARAVEEAYQHYVDMVTDIQKDGDVDVIAG